ncbi:alpha/beta fold hydrolase [Streptomyces erythrochromogenes]|uniref:alpha/beta fold hydrolase n=1 Tax=Streptomyces erythrochromogenes TaxID=285574 RepID=UPI0033FE4084
MRRDRLATIGVPTLVLDDDLDSSDISSNARAIARAVPGARRQRLAAVAHMVNLESAAHFNRAVASFLASAARH